MTAILVSIPRESGTMFEDVLGGQEYGLPEGVVDVGAEPVILDIGANIGAYAAYALDTWPTAKLHCYEPNPEAIKHFEKNIGARAELHKYAVGTADGSTVLFLGTTNLGAASLKRTTGETGAQCGVVKIMHARHLPAADILKLDCEASELDILSNYQHFDGVKIVVLEWHGRGQRDGCASLLSAAGMALHSEVLHGLERGVQKWFRPVVPHLYVAVLAGGGQTFVEHEASMRQLMDAAPRAGIMLTVAKEMGTGVDRARNRQAEAMLAMSSPPCTHLMFIDADIVFDPSWVLNMVRSNLDVVGGAYPRKQIDWNLVEAAVKKGVPAAELAEHANSFILNTPLDNGGQPNGRTIKGVGNFIEVEELGTGFLMTKREVLEKQRSETDIAYISDYEPRGAVHHMFYACQRDPTCQLEVAKRNLLKAARDAVCLADEVYPAVFEYRRALEAGDAALGRYTTEDYSHCKWARLLGFKVYCYLDAAIAHIGYCKYEGQVRHNFKVDEPETT